MPKFTELTGVFDRQRWRAPDSDYTVGYLEDGTVVVGHAAEGELVPGIPYKFFGKTEEHYQHGKQFRFVQFVKSEPHSRHGVVAYLERFATGIGPGIAGQLFDHFGSDAVKVLRTQPSAAAEACRSLSHIVANHAAEELQAIAALEDTRIELTNLFAARGFPRTLTEDAIERWGVLAPSRIRRDPFCLLVEGFDGCGFARCDRLYLDLGLDPARLKRQVICLWHVIKSDMNGHTWFPASRVVTMLSQHVSGAAVDARKAIRIGVRAKWLSASRDEDGVLWLAEANRARNESVLADRLKKILGFGVPEEVEHAVY